MPRRSIWATRRAPFSNEGEAEAQAPRRTRGSGEAEPLGPPREQGGALRRRSGGEKQRLLGTPA